MLKVKEKEFKTILENCSADVRAEVEKQLEEQSPKEDVVQRINNLHNSIVATLKITREKVIEIGQLLTEQKEKVGFGNWLKWIADNLDFGRTTATNYMNVYDAHVNGKLPTVGNLSDFYKLSSGNDEEHPEVDSDPPESLGSDEVSHGGDTEESIPDKINREENEPMVITKDDITKPNLHAKTAHKLLTNESYPVGFACFAFERKNDKIHLYIKKSNESVLRYSFRFEKDDTYYGPEVKIAKVYYMKLYAESDSDADKFNEYESKIQKIEEAQQQRQAEVDEEKNYDIATELGLSG